MRTSIHRRRRSQAESETSGPQERGDDGFVDTDLRPEAKAAGRKVALSQINLLGRRAVAVFCGREDYDWLREAPAPVIRDLMLECLPDFVHQTGGQIALAARLGGRDEVLTPIQETVEVNGLTRRILREGYLFAHFPDERVVVSAGTALGPRGEQAVIGTRSDRNAADFWHRWQDFARAHNYLRNQAFFADGQIVARKRKYAWDDVLLPEATRRLIQTHVEGFLRSRLRLKDMGVKCRRGLILAGPPGTGKTLVGKVLADTLEEAFMWVSPRHVRDPMSFEEIMQLARFVAPMVLFLEDLDLFAEERDYNGSSGLGELMNQLDGAVDNEDIVTIATTNRLEVIEKALRNRPGRFDRVVKFEAMDEPCRQRMLARLLAKAEISATDMDHLVAATVDYTGAQVEELSNTLYIMAVDANNDRADGPDTKPEQIYLDRVLIGAAIEEVRVEREARIGFHVA